MVMVLLILQRQAVGVVPESLNGSPGAGETAARGFRMFASLMHCFNASMMQD